jgi:beta-glucosidase
VVIGNNTCFPVSMARGATWDPELEERIGEAIGTELRAAGATLFGGVCVNVLRHPAWGRAQETYGEDPFHVGEMGAALTRGIQRHAMACVKHFACNSMENARFRVDVAVDEVALHEVFLPQFKRIVDEGVAVVMTAYNAVNGEWCGESSLLLQDILRDEWEFEGIVISDWILGLRDAARSLAGGLGIEMPYRMVRASHLRAALEDGSASWTDVDRAVTYLVATLLRFHAILDRTTAPLDAPTREAHGRLARDVAARAVVLLRNEPVDDAPLLPLDRQALGSLAVIGRLADTVNMGDGGSSDVLDLHCTTVLDGLAAAVPEVPLTFDPGDDPDRAAALAGAAEVAIVVVGTTFADEGEFIGDAGVDLASLLPASDEPNLAAAFRAEIADVPDAVVPAHIAARPNTLGFALGGDRTSLRLAPADVALVRAVAASNRRTVVVLQGGSALLIGEWDRSVPAVVQAWYGGREAGSGLADVLFGTVTPSARLPFSIPEDEAHLPPFDRDADRATYDRWHGWWHLERAGHVPAYPFGFGLSYTTFAWHDLDLVVGAEGLTLSGVVSNTGPRDGADVVQVYARLPEAGAPRRLVGFTRVEVARGQRRPFSLRVDADRLARRDPVHHSWLPPAGTYLIEVARHVGADGAWTSEVRW